MIKPSTLIARPAIILTWLGGAVATILTSALVYLAPTFGLPFIDFPLLIGGLFTADPNVAFWLGYWIFFLLGAFVIPAFLAYFWPYLPGRNVVTFVSALIKGSVAALILWLGSSILLWLLGLTNQLDASLLTRPGLFAFNLGILGAAELLAGHVIYGIFMALIAATGQEIAPIDTLGWPGYAHAATSAVAVRHNGQRK